MKMKKNTKIYLKVVSMWVLPSLRIIPFNYVLTDCND